MSRFAKVAATGRFVLPGPCACPSQPHDEDWIELRTELGTGDILALDAMESPVERLEYLATSWNLRDDDGTEAPLDRAHLDALYQDTYEAWDVWFRANVKVLTLPKAPDAPSPNGSRAGARSPRTKQTAR